MHPLIHRPRGFTLLELLVVVSIIAVATAGVGLALRDSGQSLLDREALRLSALLEAARARSRTTGVPVQWRPAPEGFVFDGLGSSPAQPQRWLDGATTVTDPGLRLALGPEPIIGAQQLTLVRPDAPGRALRIATDGLRPFSVLPQEP